MSIDRRRSEITLTQSLYHLVNNRQDHHHPKRYGAGRTSFGRSHFSLLASRPRQPASKRMAWPFGGVNGPKPPL